MYPKAIMPITKGIIMPNWVDTTIQVRTNNPILIDLLSSISENGAKEENVFETLCPIGAWEYDKAVATWGCKWDLTEVNVSLEELDGRNKGYVVVTISGQTAWCPPQGVVEYVYSHFNNQEYQASIRMEWIEEGGSYGIWEDGITQWEGEVNVEDVKNDTHEYRLLCKEFYLMDFEGNFEYLREDMEDEEE